MDEFLKPNEYSPLVLAYIGDSVYDLYIRGRLIENANLPVGLLHKTATEFVKASGQNAAFHIIKDKLTEEEEAVLRRGRNAKSATVPKNADITHYRHATGVEALIGHLYIKKDYERIRELMKLIYEAMTEGE